LKKKKLSPSLKIILIQEEKDKNKSKEIIKYKSSLERTKSLYVKALQKNEKSKLLKQQKDESLFYEEIRECTFKPNIRLNNSTIITKKIEIDKSQSQININNPSNNVSIFDKLSQSKQKKIERLENENKMLKFKELNVCTFHPVISSKQPSFNNLNLFDEKTVKYFERVYKARGEKLEAHRKLNPDFNSLYEKNKGKLLTKSKSINNFFVKREYVEVKNYKDHHEFILSSEKQRLHNELQNLNLLNDNVDDFDYINNKEF